MGGHPHTLNGFSHVVTKSEVAHGWLKTMCSPQAGFVLVWEGDFWCFFFFFKISSQYLSTPKTFTFNIHQKNRISRFS